MTSMGRVQARRGHRGWSDSGGGGDGTFRWFSSWMGLREKAVGDR